MDPKLSQEQGRHLVGDVGRSDEFLAGHAAEAVVGVVIEQPHFVRPEKTGGTPHAIDDHVVHPMEDVPHGAHGRFTEGGSWHEAKCATYWKSQKNTGAVFGGEDAFANESFKDGRPIGALIRGS